MQNIIQCFKKMKLSECFTFLVGGDVDKLCFSETKDDMHPYPIYANALTNKGLYGYSSKYKIKDECITITGRGDIGNVFYRKGFFTPIVRLIVAIPRENINAKFMSYACSKIRFFNETTGVPQLTVPQVQGHKVLVPPLAEQEKIAEILGAWDSAIEKLTALIAAKRLQKKGLMQKLLTARIRLPGFTGEWQKQKLGCLFSFHRSLSASRAQLGEIGIPYLHYGDIHKTGKTSFNPEKDELPKLDYRENAEKYLLKNGDVVFVDASEDRKDASRFCVIKNKNNVPFLAGLHTVVARPKSDELNVDFSEFLFQSNDFRKQVSILANGMKIFGVSKDILSNIVIRYPQNIAEQKAIADILSKADEEIDLLTRKLDLLQSQKKGLMQQLLTGKIRVKVA